MQISITGYGCGGNEGVRLFIESQSVTIRELVSVVPSKRHITLSIDDDATTVNTYPEKPVWKRKK